MSNTPKHSRPPATATAPQDALAHALADLAEEKQRRVSAEAKAALMTSLFNSTSEGVWSVGLDGLITFVNDAAVKLFAFTSVSQMLGRNSHELVHHRYPDGTPYPIELCPIFRAFKEGVPAHLTDEVLWRADGTSFYAEYKTTPVFDGGEITGTVTTFTDNTARRLAAKKISDHAQKLSATVRALEEERDLRDRFVAALTHDLRTPMAAAKLSAQLLLRELPDTAGATRLPKRIVSSMDRADRMIRDLLDASRIKAGEGVSVSKSECSLDDVVLPVLDDLREMYGPRFEVVPGPHPFEGNWDCSSLQRVLENLAGNAVKYGSPGTVVTFGMAQKDKFVEISVHNAGDAITAADQKLLFTAYHRGAAVGGPQKGWGIGLTIVKALVEAHGGTVAVQSSPEEGTTFFVRLPLKA